MTARTMQLTTPESWRTATLLSASLLVAGLFLAHAAHADGKRFGPYPEVYVQECASCHVAYPPELMTAKGWMRITATLDKHFGADAGVDAKTRVALENFLATRASTRDRNEPSEATARLTRTAWFMREHGPKPPARTSFSNCVACHTLAERIDYSERSMRLPAGFSSHKGD